MGDCVLVMDRVSLDRNMRVVNGDSHKMLAFLEGIVGFNIGDRRSDGRGSEEERSKSGNECGTHFWLFI